MDFETAWNTALKQTEIIRSRVAALQTGRDTRVPYVFLAESAINIGDTIVRKGEVIVDKPSIILPPNNPQLKGFALEGQSAFNESSMINFLLVRGVTLPSLNYDNKTHSLNVFEGDLSSAIRFYMRELQQQENVHTGLIKGSEEYWQFSILIFICSQVARNADVDIRKLLERYKDDLK